MLSELLAQCEQCAQIPLICTQLLFDCKALFQMFPDKRFLDAAQQFEAKLDPIELSVLEEPLARNSKLFAQRTTVIDSLKNSIKVYILFFRCSLVNSRPNRWRHSTAKENNFNPATVHSWIWCLAWRMCNELCKFRVSQNSKYLRISCLLNKF